jgi:hypothetical protein
METHRGCSLLTRLWMLYSDRFTGVARLGMPFTAPQPEFALDAILEFNRRTVGYDVYGYWKFFRQDDAATKMERNVRNQLLHEGSADLSALDRLFHELALPEGAGDLQRHPRF